MQSSWSKHQAQRLAMLLLLVCGAHLEAGWAQKTGATVKPAPGHGGTVEDWSSLSLAGSELKPETPTFGEKDDLPGFTRELIQVQWRKGDPIDLYVIRPKYVPKPRVILYLYSYPSETARFRDDDYCARVTSGGVAAVGFVSALTGHRYTMRPMKEWFVSELQEALGKSVHDVQMILNFLSARQDLDVSNVGMFGTGSGGTIAILAAAVDPRIKAIDVLSPWGDWPDWMAASSLIPETERPNYVKLEFLKQVAPLDPVQWLPQVKAEHIRIQNIANDTVTPKAAQARIESAAPAGAKVQRYENARQFYGAAAAGRVFQWVKDQIRQIPETKPGVENTRRLAPTAQIAERHDD
ncbi:MAG: alpha/beta hydrolase family protein [Terriglobales bacterium]